MRVATSALAVMAMWAFAVVASASTPPAADLAQRDHFKPCVRAGTTLPFKAYWVGKAFQGLTEWESTYECDRVDWVSSTPYRPNGTSVLYEGRGPLDLQVSTTPACDRNRSFFGPPLGGPEPRPVRLRGVPGTDYGDVLDLYTGDVTISLYSSDRSRLFAAAAALREAPPGMFRAPHDPGASAAADLRPPVRGHLSGRLHCGASRPRVRIVRKRRGAVTLELRAPEKGRLAGTALSDRELSVEEELSGAGEQEFSYPTLGRRSFRRTIRLSGDSSGRHTIRIFFETRAGRRSVLKTLKYRVP